MCGIVGYIGREPIDLFNLLKNGLVNLEYRGYDSAGLAMLVGDSFAVTKCIGGPGNLVGSQEHRATIGIGHTRWATHGGISESNAHPHLDCSDRIAVVHNGTIENYVELKAHLEKHGHTFRSQTDTEVIAHLLEEQYPGKPLAEAVLAVIEQLVGAYGIAVIAKDNPQLMVAARRGSPLLIGVGKDSYMIASDQNALVEYCQQVVYLDDNELVEIRPDGFSVRTATGSAVEKEHHPIETDAADAGKGEYPHFMIKEIEEQALTLAAGLRGRVDEVNGFPVLGGIRDILPELAKVTNIILTGCGTAFHAALYGKYLLEQLLNVPVRVEVASELLYEKVNEPPTTTLVIAVSQSGETADTKVALTELKRRGFRCLGIVNVAGSSIARETGVGIYTRAGVERAVASTKAFTSQMLALVLLAVTMARQRTMSKIEGQQIIAELERIPELVRKTLETMRGQVQDVAKELVTARALFTIGKKYSYPVALEGALKIKEITYIPTESYPAGELKHGPLALVDEKYMAFVVAPEANLRDAISNTVHEIQARKGKVILVTSDDPVFDSLCDTAVHALRVPKVQFNFLAPFLTVIPLQLVSYELAMLLHREIDKPRNLAKSVTVH